MNFHLNFATRNRTVLPPSPAPHGLHLIIPPAAFWSLRVIFSICPQLSLMHPWVHSSDSVSLCGCTLSLISSLHSVCSSPDPEIDHTCHHWRSRSLWSGSHTPYIGLSGSYCWSAILYYSRLTWNHVITACRIKKWHQQGNISNNSGVTLLPFSWFCLLIQLKLE